MIPLTLLEYELDEQPERVLSRLKWAVEEVEYSWLDNLNNWKPTPATHKDWVGEIDIRNLEFYLEEPGHLFKRKFNVTLEGKFEIRSSSTNVHIKLGLDNFSFLSIVALYAIGVLSIADAFSNEEFNSYFSLLFFLVGFPLFGTLLIIRRMKRAENKLDKLFG